MTPFTLKDIHLYRNYKPIEHIFYNFQNRYIVITQVLIKFYFENEMYQKAE